MNNRIIRIAGFFGIITPLFGFSVILLAIYASPWFSWFNNALSDLGVVGLGARIFNIGLVFTGIFLSVFGFGVFKFNQGRPVGRFASTILLFASVFLMGIGIFPETAGRIHFYFSVAFFVSLPLSVFALGGSLFRNGDRGIGLLSFACSLVASLVWMFPWRAVAIPEVISALSISILSFILGMRMTR